MGFGDSVTLPLCVRFSSGESLDVSRSSMNHKRLDSLCKSRPEGPPVEVPCLPQTTHAGVVTCWVPRSRRGSSPWPVLACLRLCPEWPWAGWLGLQKMSCSVHSWQGTWVKRRDASGSSGPLHFGMERYAFQIHVAYVICVFGAQV